MTTSEKLQIVSTPFGGILAEVSNKFIISATSTSLALPLTDTPCPKTQFAEVRMAHNAGLRRLMVERNLTQFWRYARIDGENLAVGTNELPVGTQIGAAIFSCGLTLCFGGPPSASPDDPCSSKATHGSQRGYHYELVSEIPCEANQVLDHFGNPYGMSNFAAGTAAQDCLWMYGFGAKSVAPCGSWVNLPWETEASIRHEWIWLYFFGKETSVMKISHGMKGTIKVGAAARRMMMTEREALEGLAKEGFRGRAVAIWPPVVVNGVPVA